MYTVKTFTKKVGLDYKHIHACVNGVHIVSLTINIIGDLS
jgi:hypothetical protein